MYEAHINAGFGEGLMYAKKIKRKEKEEEEKESKDFITIPCICSYFYLAVSMILISQSKIFLYGWLSTLIFNLNLFFHPIYV